MRIASTLPIVFLLGCAVERGPGEPRSSSAPSSDGPVTGATTSSANVAPSAAAAPSASVAAAPEEPPAASPIDEYLECPRVRTTFGEVLVPAAVAEARKTPLVWPALCGQVSGWAGIGIAESTHATGFSADSKYFVVCGNGTDECHVIDLKTGQITERMEPARPDGLDGTPVTSTSNGKRLFQKLRAPAPAGTFRYADDFRVSWVLGPRGSTLDVTLVALAGHVEVPLHRFPDGSRESEQPIVLEDAALSPDGSVLALRTFSGQGGAGFQVALVNLDEIAGAAYAMLGATDTANQQSWQSKGAAAMKRADAHPPVFTQL